MEYYEEYKPNRNQLTPISQRLNEDLLNIIEEYFERISSKYKLTELDNLLNHIIKTIKTKISEGGEGIEVSLIDEDEEHQEFEEKTRAEFINEDDFLKKFYRGTNFEKDILPAKLKDRLTTIDYLLVKAFYIFLDEDYLSKALLYFQTALTVRPDDPVAFLFYNIINADEEMNDSFFYKAIAKGPFQNHVSSDRFSFFASMISALYEVIKPEEYKSKQTLSKFLSFFESDEINLFRLLQILSFQYSHENMLQLILLAMNKNPVETKLKVLYVRILFKLQQYDKAFYIAEKLEVDKLALDQDELLSHQWVYAELLEKQNQVGKAFIEFKNIVEYKDNIMFLHDDFIEACLSLIKLYNQQKNFEKSKDIFEDILKDYESYLIEESPYKYYSLKGEMHLGLGNLEEAVYFFREASAFDE